MGQKKQRGVPVVWNELKKTRGFTLTETAATGLKELAQKHNCDSVSDFVERIGRGLIPTGKDEQIADVVEALVIQVKGLEARLSNLEQVTPTPRTVSRSPVYEVPGTPRPELPLSESPKTNETTPQDTITPKSLTSVTDGRPRCPKCGSTESNSVGFRTTTEGRYRRLKCKVCGTPFKEWIG